MRRQIFYVVFILLLCFSVGIVSAGDKQLELDGGELTQDLENIGETEVIKLTFTNNVVNLKVKDNNMTCFTMTDEDGEFVEFEVLMGDDQEDKEIKRIIEIKPNTAWITGTTYTIHVSDSLEAKNGMPLAEAIDIEFTTGGSKPGSAIIIYIILGVIVIGLIGGLVFGINRKKKA